VKPGATSFDFAQDKQATAKDGETATLLQRNATPDSFIGNDPNL